jgi:hypothetical protein
LGEAADDAAWDRRCQAGGPSAVGRPSSGAQRRANAGIGRAAPAARLAGGRTACRWPHGPAGRLPALSGARRAGQGRPTGPGAPGSRSGGLAAAVVVGRAVSGQMAAGEWRGWARRLVPPHATDGARQAISGPGRPAWGNGGAALRAACRHCPALVAPAKAGLRGWSARSQVPGVGRGPRRRRPAFVLRCAQAERRHRARSGRGQGLGDGRRGSRRPPGTAAAARAAPAAARGC